MSLTPADNTPQFGKAEFAGSSSADACHFCKQTIVGKYFRVNTGMACASCADVAKRELNKDNHAAFIRAVLFGCGGALLGLILYATVSIVTGLEIGYVSLAVGFIVGKAMKMGSGGVGGRRYQFTAVALTYAAVSMAAIPIYMYYQSHETGQAKQISSSSQTTSSDSATGSTKDDEQVAEPKSKMGFAQAVGVLVLIGLASPFLGLSDPFHGLIGLVILFVGMRFAWRFTAGSELTIDGPFDAKPVASGTSAG
jgi:hypothetical protein